MSRIIVLVLMFFLLLGCKGNNYLEEPPELHLGEDKCDECYMIINDPRFAGALVKSETEISFFDDLGDLLIFYNKETVNYQKIWVHDYPSKKWLAAKDAFYVISTRVHTPMGHGILAFKNEKDAQAFAQSENLKIYRDFETLKTSFIKSQSEN